MAPEQVQQRNRSASGGLDGTVDLARDRELVERCQRGDRTAFEELYHRYHRRLFHFCLRRLHEPYEAEDAVQEAFTKAWRALPRFAGERRFYPWLTVIAGNVCTDVLRRRSRQIPVDDVPLPLVDPDERDVDELVLHQVDAAMVVQALGRLSDRHQRVLQLREGSGWSTQQIADHEGVAVPAMETLLWRARQALKREFAALAETGGRLGVALGLGLAALRRFAFRSTSRLGRRLPAVQATSFRGPGALAASLVVAGGVVAGVAVTGHGGQAHDVAMPATATDASQPAHSTVLPATLAAGADATVPGGVAVPGLSGAGDAGGGPAAAVGGGTSAGAAAVQGGGTAGSGGAGGLFTLPGGGTGVAQAGSALATGLGGAVSGVVGGAGSAVSGIASGVGSIASGVGSVAGGVGSVVSGAGSAVSGLAGGAGSTVSSVGGSVGGGTVSSVVTSLTTTVGSVVGGLGGVLGGLTGGATTTSPGPGGLLGGG
ncbi:MAG TPA: sigma-70 family RNA polymerase sigma factor [Acidimicrobiales bacterium]|nr:sigma-70 family RNA polymerase sigma factor [Acidimicrobiales bacterium]